jgi:hypothetical protein
MPASFKHTVDVLLMGQETHEQCWYASYKMMMKFLKRSTHLAFRLYQSSALMPKLQLGPYQIGYKLQRPGRI